MVSKIGSLKKIAYILNDSSTPGNSFNLAATFSNYSQLYFEYLINAPIQFDKNKLLQSRDFPLTFEPQAMRDFLQNTCKYLISKLDK